MTTKNESLGETMNRIERAVTVANGGPHDVIQLHCSEGQFKASHGYGSHSTAYLADASQALTCLSLDIADCLKPLAANDPTCARALRILAGEEG